MKKRLLLIALAAICLFSAAGTAAFYTAEERAHNVITTGNVDIRLNEWAGTDENGGKVPFVNVLNVVPATTVTKIVEVENVGGAEAWVRVSVDTAISLAEDAAGEADASLVTIDYNTEDWTLADGWYYYNEALAPGQSTAPLFTAVSFSAEMDNMYQRSTVTVDVLTQAVQTANNGETVAEAQGWPEIGEE